MKRGFAVESSRLPLERLSQTTAGYWLAAMSTALAALLRWASPWALSPAPYLGFYPAVVISAALGGIGPGLVSTFASLLLVTFYFGRFDPSDHLNDRRPGQDRAWGKGIGQKDHFERGRP
jgi:hypothetical protein